MSVTLLVDVPHVHQADGAVLVHDGEEHARDDVGHAQAHEGVHEGMDKNRDSALVLGPGDGHGEYRVQDGDEDDLGQAPEAVAQVGHGQAVPGLVHHDAAEDEDEQRKEGEQGGEAEEGAVAEPEPGVVGEGNAHQQEQNGKKRGESDRAEELITIPEIGGNQSFLSFFHL